MSHSHSHNAAPRTPEGEQNQRRALRLLIFILIPIGVWTLVAMIVMWPGDIKDHIQNDVSTYSVPGMTVETAKVTAVRDIPCDGMPGSTQAPGVQQTCGNATVEMTTGPEKGQQVNDITMTSAVYGSGVDEGQELKLFRLPIEGSQPQYQFQDFERTGPMIFFLAAFVIAVVVVARWRGLLSVLGLGFAGFILVKFMFPALVAGANPVLVGLVGSSAIMFVVLYCAHGFNARTTTALIGTLFGLGLAAALGWVATEWAHLTGVSAEDDVLLSTSAPEMKLTSVVICGVIVAGLGVLNDVTITQASAVWELADSDPHGKKLFSRAMRIGRDHIASTVYTIAFATAGASLATLLLISVYQRPFLEVAQTEMFAAEIIRTLVGSIALILAVPLTTAIGVAVVSASRRNSSEIALADSGAATQHPNDELIDVDRYRDRK